MKTVFEVTVYEPEIMGQQRDWCEQCESTPAGQRWLCPNAANHLVDMRESPFITSTNIRWAIVKAICEEMGYDFDQIEEGMQAGEHFRHVAAELAPGEGKFGVEVEFKERK